MRTQLQQLLYTLAQRVYQQLGPSHNESVYQSALHYELIAQGFMVEREKHMDVTYIDSRGNVFNLTSDRIDIYIHQDSNSVFEELHNQPILLELKAVSKQMNDVEINQVHKYMRELQSKNIGMNYGILINFPQPTRQNLENGIDFLIVPNPYLG